ncbi:temperature dependent protein affecting M2 dsRNA replication-domain-containing protein [Phycomyces blakesleeanus]
MHCLVGPQSINTLVSGVLIENAPLDNGETAEYRNFLIQLLDIRTQTLSLLTQPLHQYYQGRKVVSYFWFDPNTEHVMHHHDDHDHSTTSNTSPLNTVYEMTSSWNVTKELIENEKAEQHKTKPKLQRLFQNHRQERFCISRMRL